MLMQSLGNNGVTCNLQEGAKERTVLTGPPFSLYFVFQYSFGFKYVVVSLQFRSIFQVI